MSEPHMRAADSDRTAVAAALGRHMAEGRLTLEEYEERVGRAYAARTYGELTPLTADLPSSGLQRSGPRPVPRRTYAGACAGASWSRGYRRAVWSGWLTTAMIVTTIWLATSLAAQEFIYFWPFWVVGPWGIVLLSRTFGRSGGRRSHPGHRLPG
jgi:hypothetical protein